MGILPLVILLIKATNIEKAARILYAISREMASAFRMSGEKSA